MSHSGLSISRSCPHLGLLSVEIVCQADLQESFSDWCKHPQESKGGDLSLSGGGFQPPSTSRIISLCFPKSRDNT